MVSVGKVLLSYKPTSSKNLFKYLLRTCEKLPKKETTQFYKTVVRKEFEQHTLEDDPERVDQIMQRAVLDADWIVKKYNK